MHHVTVICHYFERVRVPNDYTPLSGQYRFYVNSGYNLEQPYICVKHEGHFAKFSLQPLALQSNNGFSRTELGRIQQAIADARDRLLKHWTRADGSQVDKPTGDLLLHQE